MMKHVLILAEEQFLAVAASKQKDMQDVSCVTEVISDTVNRSTIETLLEKQPLGTSLLIVAKRKTADLIQHTAHSIGYAVEDISVLGPSQGEGEYRIFCSQCHEINVSANLDRTIVCKKCGQQLEPSDHYSKYHQSFLGYPVV